MSPLTISEDANAQRIKVRKSVSYCQVSVCHYAMPFGSVLTLSVGSMLLKVVPPDKGFFSPQDLAHWLLCDEIASSNALP